MARRCAGSRAQLPSPTHRGCAPDARVRSTGVVRQDARDTLGRLRFTSDSPADRLGCPRSLAAARGTAPPAPRGDGGAASGAAGYRRAGIYPIERAPVLRLPYSPSGGAPPSRASRLLRPRSPLRPDQIVLQARDHGDHAVTRRGVEPHRQPVAACEADERGQHAIRLAGDHRGAGPAPRPAARRASPRSPRAA